MILIMCVLCARLQTVSNHLSYSAKNIKCFNMIINLQGFLSTMNQLNINKAFVGL